MKATIYSKQRKTKDGRQFYTFLTRLVKKDGEVITCAVKFRDDAGMPDPKRCPMNIVFDKKDANFAVKKVELANGEPAENKTLWISKWAEGEPYVDTSMDDFDE